MLWRSAVWRMCEWQLGDICLTPRQRSLYWTRIFVFFSRQLFTQTSNLRPKTGPCLCAHTSYQIKDCQLTFLTSLCSKPLQLVYIRAAQQPGNSVVLEWECGWSMRLGCIKKCWFRKCLRVTHKHRKVGRPRLRWLGNAENYSHKLKVKRRKWNAIEREQWTSVIRKTSFLKGL